MTNEISLEKAATIINEVNIGIIYFSAGETTASVAEQVAAGAEETGATIHPIPIIGTDSHGGRCANHEIAEKLAYFDANIFRSPTYMGSVSGQMKSFMDAMAP